MNKHEFLEKVSKIDQTEQDEFKAEYNSPERMWELVIKPENKRRNRLLLRSAAIGSMTACLTILILHLIHG